MIAHIVLNVSNFKRSKLFYDALLSELGYVLAVEMEEEWGASISYKYGEHNIWIKFERNNTHKPFVRDVGLDHLALLAKSKMQVDQLYNLVCNFKVFVSREPQDYPEYNEKYYAFYFRDPDGIPLEVVWK